MATDSELRARELRLEAERKRWETDKVDFEREIAKLKAERQAVASEVAPLLQKQAAIIGQNKTLLAEYQAKSTEIAEIDKVIAAKEAAVEQKASELASLDNIIAEKQAGVDTYIADYKRHRETKAERELEALKADVEATKAELARLRTELKEAVTNQDAAVADAESRAEAAKAVQKVAEEKAEAALAELSKVEADVRSAKGEHLQLVHNYKDLEGRAVAVRAEHEALKKYEAEAKAILKAKDEELQEREANLSEGEHMLANRRSFLPKMD